MAFKIKTAGIIAFTAVFFILDRGFKMLFIGLWRYADFTLGSGWLRFKLAYNTGVAFSLPLDQRLILALTILLIVGLIYVAAISLKKNQAKLLFALTLVIAGALSNLIDRLAFSAVIDYIDFYHLTVLNLSDAMITAGIALIIIICLADHRPQTLS